VTFSFQEGISRETVRLIADNCQHITKLSLDGWHYIIDDDVIHVIEKLGKQLSTLSLNSESLTDVAFLQLKDCVR
jgi:hypothetical protein